MRRLTADPARDRIFASVNEDNNSSLYVITPGNAMPIAHYSYSKLVIATHQNP